MTSKFYIATAIDYVNGKPHMGHAYEKICADCLARWHRLIGDDVFFLTGTDENGQKNERAAKEAGMETMAFVDMNTKEFVKLCSLLGISNDDFIRTTEERHKRVASAIFSKLNENGLIYKSLYKGLYCEGCEGFLTEKDLVNGKCPEHNKEPKEMEEEAYFFKLSSFKDRIIELIEKGSFIFPDSRKNEILARLKSDELRDLCVSRKGIGWGIENPIDREYKIYVWIDALTNYISALDYPGKKFKQYWPADVHMIGKGINWFHSVIWPAILMGCEMQTPKKIVVHGYVTSGGQKIGKSLGNAIDPIALAEKYSPEMFRYFLIREIPFGEDGDFSEQSLKERINNELVANYGNLFYRITSFIENNFGTVPEQGEPGEAENMLESSVKKTVEKVSKLIEEFRITEALKEVMELSSTANKYFQDKEPWKKIKSEPQDAKTALYYSVNALNTISILLYPFLPKTTERAVKLLDVGLITNEIKPYILSAGEPKEKKFFDPSMLWERAGKLSIKPGSKVFSEILVKKIE
jgi:methionyl-tRNA synthetase